ncbi:MAG: amidohydrolase family protein [Acidimicrobiia bacterium]
MTEFLPESDRPPEVVDAHSHYTPHAAVESGRTRRRDFPHVQVRSGKDDTTSFGFPSLPPTRPIPHALWDRVGAHEWMDRVGIDAHVVGPWSDLFGYTLPADEGAAWSRFLNEETRNALRRDRRFITLATVPLQDGAQAVGVLSDAFAIGHAGVTVGTTIPERELDHPDLEGFWQTAANLKMPVFMHPMYAYGDSRLADYGLPNAIGRLNQTAIAVARLLYSGMLDRYPTLKIIVAHGGGVIPFAIGRLRRNFQSHGTEMADPAPAFAKLSFDTVVYDVKALRYLVETAGPDHVLLGSDYPFPIYDPDPRRIVHDAGFDRTITAAILGGNARRLFESTNVD